MTRAENTYRIASCRSCSAPIIWAVSNPELKSGRPMPVDAAPHPNGNVLLARDPSIPHDPGAPVVIRATVMRAGQIAGARADGNVLYRPHWATCPHADRWRNPKANAARHAKKGGRR